MRSFILAAALTATFAGSALAQAPGGDPARQVARAECRQQAHAQGLRGTDVRESIRACMRTRFGQTIGPRQAELMALRQSCRANARSQGLRGPAVRASVIACMQAQRPDLARIVQCRQNTRASGLVPRTPEFRAAVRACAA